MIGSRQNDLNVRESVGHKRKIMTSIADATDNFHDGLYRLIEAHRFLDKLQAALLVQTHCCVTTHDIIQAQQACRFLENKFRESVSTLISTHVRDALDKQTIVPASPPRLYRQSAGFGPIGSEFGFGGGIASGLKTPPQCRRELFPYSAGESEAFTQPPTEESLECNEEYDDEEIPETP